MNCLMKGYPDKGSQYTIKDFIEKLDEISEMIKSTDFSMIMITKRVFDE